MLESYKIVFFNQFYSKLLSKMISEDDNLNINQLKHSLEEAIAIIREKDAIIHRLEEENKKLKFQSQSQQLVYNIDAKKQSQPFSHTPKIKSLMQLDLFQSSQLNIPNQTQTTSIDPSPTSQNSPTYSRKMTKVDGELAEISRALYTRVIGDRFFENFLIIGPDYDRLNLPNQSGIVEAQIISSIPYDTTENYLSIPSHLFPAGVPVERFRSRVDKPHPKLNQLYENVFKTYSVDNSQNEFVFSWSHAESYDKKINRNPIVVEMNHDLQLYCICFEFNDYYTEPQTEEGVYNWYQFPMVACFITYFPFLNFFMQMNASILNEFKKIRCDNINDQILKTDIKVILEEINRSQPINTFFCVLQHIQPQYETQYPIQLTSLGEGNYVLRISNRIECQYEIFKWSAPKTFQHFSYQNINFLFTAMLLEFKLVFFSNNKSLLTSTILTLRALMKPFKYSFTICPLLPNTKLHLLEYNTPYILGVLGSFSSHKQQLLESLDEDLDDLIFVDVDNRTIKYHGKQRMSNLQEYAPSIPEAKKHYHEYNNTEDKPFENYNSFKSSPNFKSLMKSVNRQKESPSFKYPSSSCLRKVFQAYEIYIHNQILRLIPTEKYWKDGIRKVADINKIVKVMRKQLPSKSLPYHFVETQSFSYFIDERYESL